MAFLSLNSSNPTPKETSMSIQWIKSLRASKTRRRRFATSTLGTTGIAIAVVLALFLGDGAKAQNVVVTPASCTVDGGVAASSVSNVCDGSQATKTVFTADAIVLKVTLSKPAIVTGVNITPGDDDNLYPYRVASATQIQGCTSAGQGCETAGTNAFSYYEVSIVGAGLNQTFDASRYGCEILGTGTRCLQFSEITFNTSVTTRTLSFGSVATQTYNTTQTVTATASAGTGTITYSSSDTGKCTVDSSTGVVTATSGTGTCTITASVASDGVYSAATASVDITLAKAVQATFNFTRSTFMMVWDGVAYTEDITFTPSGGSGTGSVSYSVSNNTATNCSLVPNGSAWTISADTGGQCRITAVKAGDSNYLAATFSTSTYTGVSTYADFLFQRATLANPTGLSATPIAQSSSLTVSFTKAANATDTQVALFVDGTTTSTFKTATISGTSYTFTGLTANTTYYFAAKSIAATNDAYYFSASSFSSRVSATTNIPTALAFSTPTSGLSATKGTFYSIDLSGLASGGYGLKTFTVTGSLPAGLTLSGSTISGTPTTEGSFSITSTVRDEDLASATTSSFAIVVAPVAPTITTQPATTTTVAEGGSATLSVTATGTALSYQWKKDGTAISGATSSSLVLNPVGVNDGGTYTVDVRSTVNLVPSAAKTSSNAALVVVDAPVISSQPADKKSYLSVSNTFSVSATVSTGGAITYVWELSTNGGATWTAIGLATSSTYSFTPSSVAIDNGKQFRVKVTNTRNSVTKTTISAPATLSVYSSFNWGTVPSSVNMSIGSPYSLDVDNFVTGGIPTLSYQVLASSLPSGISFDSTTGVLSGTPARGTVSGSYSISIRSVDGLGGVSAITKAISIAVGKGVYDTPTGLVATTTSNTLKSITVTWDALTMPAWVNDSGGYRVEMYSSNTGGTLLRQKDVSTNQVTFTVSDYSSMLDSTTYYFQVQARSTVTTDFVISVASTRVSGTTLTPSATPSLTTALASTTYALASTSVTLHVSASVNDGGTISYQWYKAGVAVSGATSDSLTVISNSDTLRPDAYYVNVTNSLNGVPSIVVKSSTTLQSVSFTVNSYTSGQLAGWTVNTPINHSANTQIWGSGSGDSLTYQLTSGSLPLGVSFSTTTGTFSGTPGEGVTNRSMTVVTTSTKTGLTNTTTFSINIAKISQASLTLSLSATTSPTGAAKAVTVSVGGGSGIGAFAISIANGTSSSCQIDGGTSPISASAGANTVTLSSSTKGNQGSCSVVLTKAGDSAYNSATRSTTFLFLNPTDTPGSFSATATANTKKSIKLTWTNSGPTSSATASYRVGIYTASGSFITNVSSVAGSLQGSTYSTIITATQFPAIADGTTYKFDLTSVGNGTTYGESLPTSFASATTYIVATTPTISDGVSTSQSVAVGGTISLSAAAAVSDGGTLTYQWQVATSSDSYASWSNVSGGTGENTDTYTTASLTNSSVGYKYRLKTTNTLAGPDASAFAVAYSSQFTVTVTKVSQTITFANPGDKLLSSGTFTVSPTTTATGLSVSVNSATTGVCSISGSTVTLVSAGTCTLNANQSGDSTYDSAPQVTQSFTVSYAAQTISFIAPASKTYGDSVFSISATASSDLAVTFTSATTAICTVSGNSLTLLAAGTCTINADQAGDSSYAAATRVSRSFTVSPKPLTQGAVTATSPAGERMTISATWTAVTNATGYVVKLWTSGTTERQSFTVDANTTSQTFSPTNTTNLVDNAPYTVSVMATGTGNYTNSAVVHSSLTYTRTVAVVNYNPQQGAGYSPSEFSGTLPSQQRYINGAASPLTVSLNSGNYARVGYDFMGWNTQPNGSGTTYTPGVTTTYGDINLWPMWERTELTVTFNSNYGTETTTTQTFEYGVLESLDANTFTRTGYAFAGWATTSGGSVVQTDSSGIIVTANRTLYAKWTAIDYTVTYVANGSSASVPTETAKNYQDTVTVKAAITRTGYDFQGWSDGTTTYNPTSTLTMPSRNVTLTALWQIQVYTITYNDASASSGSSSRSSDNYTYGYPAIALPTEGTLAKTGYNFGGWSETLGGSAIVGNYTPTSSKTLYAVWTPITYTVNYNSNGATGALEKTSDSYTTGGTAITLPGAGQMIKAGHTFDGWATTTTGSKILGTYTTSTNRTLYARWVAVSYTITYDAAGGSSTPTQASKTIGQTFTLAAGPTKTNFEFAGWNDGTTTYDAGYTYVVEDANITLTAEWVEIFWIHYNYNGANETEPADLRKLNGQSYTAGDAVTKNGFTFAGWKSQSNAAIAAGQTFTVNANNYILSAQWTPIDYHITYASAGGVVLPTETDKNIAQTFTVANALTRSGYIFNGWNDGALTYGPGATYAVGASNVTLTAQWTAIQYDVTYDLALGTSSVPVQSARIVGQTFAVAAMPSRYGYSFIKWSDGTNDYQPAATYTMPANDVTLTAVWQATSLGITYNLNGGSGTAPTETNKTIGSTFSLAGIASWLNHTFQGWFDGTTLFGAGDTYTVSGEPVNLVARWLANLFSANFLPGGASGSNPTTVDREAGQTFSLPSASGLNKTSHTFAGWTDGLQTYQPGDIIAMPSQGTTFTALWTPDPTPPSSGGGSGGPTVPIVTPPFNNTKTLKVTFGTAKSLAKAAEIIGTPVKWKSESPNCKVDAKGVVTTIAVGECSITAIDKATLKIASVFNLVVEPRLKISLKSISNLKPTSARLNASVAWPGANFQAKFCVATSATATDCKYLSSISISNETNNSVVSKGSVAIARDIQGLTPGTRYFVHAAVLVGDKSYKTAVQMLRTPKKNVANTKPDVVTLQFPEFTTVLLPAQEKALGASVLQWKKLGLKTVVITPEFKKPDYNYFLNDRINQLTDYVKSRLPGVKVVVVGYEYTDGRLIGDVPMGQRGITLTAR